MSVHPNSQSLGGPSLHLQTASLYVSDDGAAFSGSGGPFGYSPDTGQFGGIISSAGLAAQPFQDNLTDVAAGDIVTFVITVENTAAGAAAYAIVLQNLIPDGFVLPANGAGVSVTDGAGTALDFSGDLFDPFGGLALNPAVAITGYDPDSGSNVLLVTFSLQVAADAPVPQALLHSAARLVQYAPEPGANSGAMVQADGITASTDVATAAPTLTLVSQAPPAGVPLGGTAVFDIGVTLPEGRIAGLHIDDLLPAGLSFVSARILTIGAQLTLQTPLATEDSTTGSFDLGTVMNAADGVVDDGDRLRIEVTSRATGSSAASMTVQAVVSATSPTDPQARWSTSANTTVTVTAPSLALTLDAPQTAQAGEIVTFTQRLNNATGAASAFGLHVTDTLASGLTLVPGSLTASGTRAAPMIDGTSGSPVIGVAELDAGETLVVTFQGQVAPGASAGAALAATTAVRAATLANDPNALVEYLDASAVTRVTAPNISVVVIGADALKIGEIATFSITATLPEGNSPAFQLLDALPIGLDYVAGSASVVSVGAGIGSLSTPAVTATGRSVAITLGPIATTSSGARQVVVELQAQVSSAAALGSLLNSATVETGFADSATGSATATVINTPPQITGLSPRSLIPDNQSVRPFAGLQITDPDAGGQQVQTATIQVSDPLHGALTSLGAGAYDPASGTYHITGSTASVAAAVSALNFLPTQHLAPFGLQVTTDFTVQVTDDAGGQTSAVTEVAAVTANSPPSLTGSWAGQAATTRIAVSPFAGLTLSDPDVGQGGALTIQLSNPSQGTLSSLGLGAYDAAAGTYTASGPLADLQAAARNLVFSPAPASTPLTTQFTLTLDDGAGGVVSDTQTSLRVTPSTDTAGIAEHFGLSPTATFLTASNGGQTLARGEVYGGPVDYLRSIHL